MNILATYTDTNQRTYNIVDILQEGDPILYNHVYVTTENSAYRDSLPGQITECTGIACETCIFNNEPCSGLIDITVNPRFDEFFPDFRQTHPELFI